MMFLFCSIASIAFANLLLIHALSDSFFPLNSVEPVSDFSLDDASLFENSDKVTLESSDLGLQDDILSDLNTFADSELPSNPAVISNSAFDLSESTTHSTCETEDHLTDELQARDKGLCRQPDNEEN